MNILAFDTGLNKTYISLSIDGQISSKVIESTEQYYHSAFLIQEIVNLLSSNNLKPQDINLIATNVGPGSFTGIRVGLTVARVFAQSTNADVVGVNSLELISKAYTLPAITILDARKNKAYVGNDEKIELLDLEQLPEMLKKFDGKIIADNKMQDFLYENGIISFNYEKEHIDYGKILLNIAKGKFLKGNFSKWQGLKPLYIQPPPIHKK